MFRRYFDAFRKWLWLLVITTLVSGGVTFALSESQPTSYTAKVQLLVGPATTSLNPAPNDLRAAAQLLEVYAVLPTMQPFLEDVISDLELDMTPSQLEQRMTITTSSTTQILTISLRHEDRDEAMRIANTIADLLVARSAGGGEAGSAFTQLTDQIERVETTITRSEERLADLEQERLVATTDSQRSELTSQISQERSFIAESERLLVSLYSEVQNTPNNRVEVLEPADQGALVRREVPLKTALGAVAGMVLGVALILALDYLDDRLKSESGAAQAAGLPVLGTVARHRALRGVGSARLVVTAFPTSRAAQNYRKLGAKIIFLNSNQSFRSVLIGSPRGAEDSGEVAANVAGVLAQLGRSVILVDSDLRNAVVSRLFGLDNHPGLTDLFDEEQSISECVVPVDSIPNLFVLPSGLSGNAKELLASENMVDLIEHLQSLADIILLSSPPLLEQAEGMVLASRVHGVLLPTFYARTRRSDLREAVADLHALGANVVGTIFAYSSQRKRRLLSRRRSASPALETGSVNKQLPQSERAQKSV